MSIKDEIATIANARFPEEACGFVLRDGTVIECANVAEDPVNTFRFDPQDVALWWETEQVTAMWHTHPLAPAVPSEQDQDRARDTDLAMLGWAFLVYSVCDEDLGWYAWDTATDQLELTMMEMAE